MAIKLHILAKNPKQKIHWALNVLLAHNHVLGRLVDTAGQPKFEIDDQLISIQDVYRLVSKYPEWNDRLGIGTASLLPISSSR